MRPVVALLNLGVCADCVGISHTFPTRTPTPTGAYLEALNER